MDFGLWTLQMLRRDTENGPRASGIARTPGAMRERLRIVPAHRGEFVAVPRSGSRPWRTTQNL
jgi:hypothetical protein